MPHSNQHLPDSNRLSVLLGGVLLAYALTQIMGAERGALDLTLLGLSLSLPLNLEFTAIFMATGLTATGADWLLRGHPGYDGRPTLQHWMMPALTAIVLGATLYRFAGGLLWWLSFGVGAVLLLFILMAEYIALDSADLRYPLAAALLSALSFALFIIFAITLASSATRLMLSAGALFLAAGMVTLRNLHLRFEQWSLPWAATTAFIIVQLSAALHYLPLSPLQFGLILTGPLFSLNNLALSLGEETPPRQAYLEAALSLLPFWVTALFL
jgi:hypothetical protein